MENLIGKPATRAWRESKTSLSFKNWINREKEKLSADGDSNLLLVDRKLNDSVQNIIKETLTPADAGKKKAATILGVNQTVFILSSLLFTAGTIYLITRISKS